MENAGRGYMVNNSISNKTSFEIDSIEINDLPLKWCSVSLSEIINMGRLDASCFDIESKNILNIINSCKYPPKTICGSNGLATAYRPGICKRAFVEPSNDSIDMLTPSQIVDVKPKAEKHLSSKMKDNISNWFAREGELLLTCSGTIGKSSIVTNTLKNRCISQNLIRIVVNEEVYLGYIYAYFNTTVGQTLLTRNNYGAVIQHIDPNHLENIIIPNASKELKEKIHNLIMNSFKLRDESNELIDEATQLMINQLKLPLLNNFSVNSFDNYSNVDTFNVKLSNIDGRIDASYHVPIVNAIVKHLQQHASEVITIGDIKVSKAVILPGRFKRIYVDEGYGITFFSGKNITELNPSDKKYLSFSQHNKKIVEELMIKENMILVTCSGTIGKIALVPKHWNNWAMTHDIIRLVPQDSMQGYVYIWLQSEYAAKILESKSYGSVVSHIEKIHLEEMPIPLLKDINIQEQINNLAIEANKKRFEAYELEQRALEIMNHEIIFAK